MSKQVLKNVFFSFDGVDLSSEVEQLEIDYGADQVESTAMGNNTHVFLGGLFNWPVTVTFRQDYAAAKVDATLFPKMGLTGAMIVRPDAGVVSATNPQFTGTMLLTSYPPVTGSVGDIAGATAEFVPAGDLSRATS